MEITRVASLMLHARHAQDELKMRCTVTVGTCELISEDAECLWTSLSHYSIC